MSSVSLAMFWHKVARCVGMQRTNLSSLQSQQRHEIALTASARSRTGSEAPPEK